MATLSLSGYPLGKYRLRWYDGATLIASEEWRAMNTDYDPLRTLRQRTIRLTGLSTVYHTTEPDERLIDLQVVGTGMPRDVAERILNRIAGTDDTQDWHALTVMLDDEFGNEWEVILAEMPFKVERGRSSVTYDLKMFVDVAPDTILIGYC